MLKHLSGVDYGVVGGLSFFLLIGTCLLAFGLLNVWRGLASERWPTTAAVVKQSDSSGSAFAYQVDGRGFVTSLRHFGQTGSAPLAVYRYPTGAAVTVSYDPGNPSLAVAEPGFDADALWLLGGGLAFAFPSVTFMVMWFAMSRNNNRALAVGMGMFSTVFVTFGMVLLANGLPALWRSYQSPLWPKTPGVIVRAGGGTGERHFVYRYEIDKRIFFSDMRRFGQVDDRTMQHNSLYPLGGEITVRYSPGNPAISTVETGIVNETWWIPGAGAAFFLFGLMVFFVGIPALTR
jgi:hypothetical protein